MLDQHYEKVTAIMHTDWSAGFAKVSLLLIR